MADAPLELLLDPAAVARFWGYVDRANPNECWLWRRALNGSGYGVMRHGRDRVAYSTMAHRAAWIITTGRAIPSGSVLDHMCGRRSCCNPAHLRPVTQSANVRASARHLAGTAPVVRVGPKTLRTTRGGRCMVIWREYLEDGKVRQAGRVYETREAAERAIRGVDVSTLSAHESP